MTVMHVPLAVQAYLPSRLFGALQDAVAASSDGLRLSQGCSTVQSRKLSTVWDAAIYMNGAVAFCVMHTSFVLALLLTASAALGFVTVTFTVI